MKEMTNVASAVMTDEEKAEMERNLKSQGESAPSNIEHQTNSAAAATATAYAGPANPTAPPESTANPSPSRPTMATSESVPPSPAPGLSVSPSPSPGPSPSTSPAPGTSSDELRKKKGKQKLTPEQKQKLEEIEKERRQAMEKRVKMLTEKLIERIRPFVDAERPGDPNDTETIAFQEKMRREAEDLKFESFGVEVSRGLSIRLTAKQLLHSCYIPLVTCI